MSDSSSDNKKTDALEMKVAFLEDSLEKLSEEFYTQQKIIDGLQRQQKNLLHRVRDLTDSNESNEHVADEKPPHY